MARAGDLRLPGFPDFSQTVKEMHSNQDMELPSYEVCVGLPNGTLAIKQSIIDYWLKQDDFIVDIEAVVKEHNSKYNPHGIKRGCEEAAGESTSNASATQSKRLKVESSVKAAEQESKFGETLLG